MTDAKAAASTPATASTASSPAAASADLAVVLDFLFAANLDAPDAFATARAFIEAGIATRDAIRALAPARAKELAPKKAHRKLLAALRKMPTLECAATPAAAPEEKAQLPPPPAAPAADQPLPEAVVLNRSPVMILWAAACAFVLEYEWAEALSLGSACAALFARAKGASLGLYASGASPQAAAASTDAVMLMGQRVPALRLTDGHVRGLTESKHGGDGAAAEPALPAKVHRYLASAYGDAFGACWHEFLALARSVPREALAADEAYNMYAQFRPEIPGGLAGWGAPGRLLLTRVVELRRRGDAGGDGGGGDGGAGDGGGGLGGLFDAIAARSDGATPAELAAAVGADVTAVAPAIEELQLDGTVYERGGRFFAL